MNKKAWEKIELKELQVKNTEHGTSITPHVDATYQAGKFTFYSFS